MLLFTQYSNSQLILPAPSLTYFHNGNALWNLSKLRYILYGQYHVETFCVCESPLWLSVVGRYSINHQCNTDNKPFFFIYKYHTVPFKRHRNQNQNQRHVIYKSTLLKIMLRSVWCVYGVPKNYIEWKISFIIGIVDLKIYRLCFPKNLSPRNQKNKKNSQQQQPKIKRIQQFAFCFFV